MIGRARVGLLAAAVLACASIEEPNWGPPWEVIEPGTYAGSAGGVTLTLHVNAIAPWDSGTYRSTVTGAAGRFTYEGGCRAPNCHPPWPLVLTADSVWRGVGTDGGPIFTTLLAQFEASATAADRITGTLYGPPHYGYPAGAGWLGVDHVVISLSR